MADTDDMRVLVGAILDLPLQSHRSGGWSSLEPDDIWGGSVLFVDKVALPMAEVAIQLMKVTPDEDEALDNMTMAIKRVRRWAVLEKGGSSNSVFQKEFFGRVIVWAHGQ
ncbi:unnamed protein product [Ectocarpus fasciculatus]